MYKLFYSAQSINKIEIRKIQLRNMFETFRIVKYRFEVIRKY